MTEEDLVRIERCLPPIDPSDGESCFAVTLGGAGTESESSSVKFDTDDVRALIVEVRRLRGLPSMEIE